MRFLLYIFLLLTIFSSCNNEKTKYKSVHKLKKLFAFMLDISGTPCRIIELM